jgi:elongation factor P
MKIDGVSIRPGNVLDHKGKLWVVNKTQHTQPGKGGAYMQVEMKAIKEGTKLNERFRSDERVERVRLEQKDHTFLYEEGEMLTFMDVESYEQISLHNEILGDLLPYLQEGMTVQIESHEGESLGITIPDTVTLEVAETEAVVKGQTAASSSKPAIMENGVRVMVPPFIEAGVRIVVNTADSTYVERAKD